MSQDLNKLTVKQLKEHLKSRGLKLGGKKAELVARLSEALGQKEAEPSPVPDLVPPEGYKPAMVDGLPVVSPAPKPKSPKAPKKTPQEVLTMAIRDADLTLKEALRTLLETYGVDDFDFESFETIYDEPRKPKALDIPESEEELSKLRVTDLKKFLKSRGQKVGGKKAELVARILNPEATSPSQESPIPPPDMVQPVPVSSPIPPSEMDIPPIPGMPAAPAVPNLPVPEVPTSPAEFPAPIQIPTLPASADSSEVPVFPTELPTLPDSMEVPALPTELPTLPESSEVPALPTELPTLPESSEVPALPTELPTLPDSTEVPALPTELPTELPLNSPDL